MPKREHCRVQRNDAGKEKKLKMNREGSERREGTCGAWIIWGSKKRLFGQPWVTLVASRGRIYIFALFRQRRRGPLGTADKARTFGAAA